MRGMRRQAHGGYGRIGRFGSVVATACAVAAFLACGAPKVVQLPQAPASKLDMSVRFSNALIPSAQTTVFVYLSDTSGDTVALISNQALTINGIHSDGASPPMPDDPYTFTVPRAPLGGSYTLTYSDERGQQTSVAIPAAQRDLAITAPAANARVPIPQPSANTDPSFAIHYTAPFDPATLPVPISAHEYRPPYEGDIFGACRTTGYEGTPSSYARCALVGATEPIGTDGVIAKDNPNDPPAFRFGNIAPGPGLVSVDAHVVLLVPPAGFHALSVTFEDSTTIPITWV